MRIDNPLLAPPAYRQAGGPDRGRARQALEKSVPLETEGGRDDLKPIFRVNIEDLPSICQGEQSHAINGNHDPL